MNTRMDQWGFQGITILWKILGILLLRELLRYLENLNGVPLLQGSLYTMGNNNIFFLMEALRDLGKSQWSSFIWGVYDGITARFGKISMEFLHLGRFTRKSLRDLGKSQWSSFTWGGLQGNQTVVSKVQVTSTHMDQ